MDNVEKMLENPIVRLTAGFGLMVAAGQLMTTLLVGLVRTLGVFERGLFDRDWNISRVQWISIFLMIAAWVAIGLVMKFDPLLIAGPAGAFFVWQALVANIAIDLPSTLAGLVSILHALFGFVGIGLGLLMLSKVDAPMNLSTPNLGATGAGPTGPGAPPAPLTAPGQMAAPTQTAAAASPAPGAPEPGWFADPKGEAELRWWDGTTWTDNTN